jgi:hypothetical protein
MKPVLIAWSQQDKQLWPGADDSLTVRQNGYREWLCGGFAVRFQEDAYIGVDVGVYEAGLKVG